MNKASEKIRDELRELISLGDQLYAKLFLESKNFDFDDPPLTLEQYAGSAHSSHIDENDDMVNEEYDDYLEKNQEEKQTFEKAKKFTKGIKSFGESYEKFYTLSIRVIGVLAPERRDDFIKQYKDDKRKTVTVANYLIADAIVGYHHTHGNYGRSSALPRMKTQVSIIRAIQESLDNSLFEIEELARADIFDSELDSASHLVDRGHVRAAGAVAGVVLEKHLSHVAERHNFSSRKKHPGIADFNEHLKTAGVIDIPTWRRIQSFADIRNNCDHHRFEAPSKNDVIDLINGIKRVIKEVM